LGADQVDAAVKSMGEGNPTGRVADPREMGKAAVFLSSDASSFITGVELFAAAWRRCEAPAPARRPGSGSEHGRVTDAVARSAQRPSAAVKAEVATLEFLRSMGADSLNLSVLPAERRRFLATVGRRLTANTSRVAPLTVAIDDVRTAAMGPYRSTGTSSFLLWFTGDPIPVGDRGAHQASGG
jgi:hypothetical protein